MCCGLWRVTCLRNFRTSSGRVSPRACDDMRRSFCARRPDLWCAVAKSSDAEAIALDLRDDTLPLSGCSCGCAVNELYRAPGSDSGRSVERCGATAWRTQSGQRHPRHAKALDPVKNQGLARLVAWGCFKKLWLRRATARSVPTSLVLGTLLGITDLEKAFGDAHLGHLNTAPLSHVRCGSSRQLSLAARLIQNHQARSSASASDLQLPTNWPRWSDEGRDDYPTAPTATGCR